MKLNKSTLSIQIYQILREDILTQVIPQGTKLTLKMLQERFQVSSTPIRDAITRLSEEGLVEYYSNIGVNVISLTGQDLEELYQFMGDLDSLSILYASAHPDQASIRDQLQRNIEQTSSIERFSLQSEEEIQSWITASDRFHLIFYDYCRNSRLTAAANRLRSQLTIFSSSYERQELPQKEILAAHRRICEAYCSGDAAKAAGLMKDHLLQSLKYTV